MKLADHYRQHEIAISFELFPPKTTAGDAALMRHVDTLASFRPKYFTCTYGAGGSTRDKTLGIISEVKSRWDVPVASHLTCVGSTASELRTFLASATDQQIDYIVALRGDPPQGATTFRAVEGGFRYANELVEFVRAEFPHFGIAVAGYPEKHQEAPSLQADLANLKRKVDTGADIVITQLFYDNADYFRFQDACQAIGIDVPIIPGVLPVTSLSQIRRISELCGAQLPTDFVRRLSERDDPEWQMEVGIAQATEQVRRLVEHGVSGLHFYVLNQSHATSRVLGNLQFDQVGPA